MKLIVSRCGKRDNVMMIYTLFDYVGEKVSEKPFLK